ncbi:hypothetical protein [Hoyosella subflava]|uniref:Secreted protein n=1 Tax=Hoyosella subflava (strain DSM 45089 / JCM 17490 / NBRC 109087 / DQS3-9A1) TaxID=443218 RepID=F6EJ18_HOYSD|nr:hypothetical protein [Hoyosella subflava]AEF41250.1 hypothetical protein AS9A_2803 [Hoyosella subflava DQS3-9A1]
MRRITRGLFVSAAVLPLAIFGSGVASAGLDDIDASAMEIGPITIVTVSGAQPDAECVTVPPQIFGGTADADGNAFMILLSDTVLLDSILVTCVPGALLVPDVTTAQVDSGSLAS